MTNQIMPVVLAPTKPLEKKDIVNPMFATNQKHEEYK